MIHGHGNDLYKYNNIIADFSSNIWYKGLSAGLSEYLKNNINRITHYPEPDAKELADKIAKLHNISEHNILVTNGATEAFYLLAHLFPNRESSIFYPAFAEYEDACKSFKHKLDFHNIKDFENVTFTHTPSLVWIGNPNNPDGTLFKQHQIKDLCERHSNSVFVIDEAYIELCAGAESSIKITDTCENLIIVRSFTKAFAIPGIRLGYIVAEKSIINNIKKIKMPWSVNEVAILAGLYITEHYNELLPNKESLLHESTILQNQLAEISGIKITPTKCNYILVKLEKGDASQLKQFLATRYKLLIRDASNFRGLNSSHFRIAVQTPQNNELLINGIEEWLNNLNNE